MSELDGDAGRDFEGLDAREAQQALAEEMSCEMEPGDDDGNGKEDAADVVSVSEVAGEGADESDVSEIDFVEEGDGEIESDVDVIADGEADENDIEGIADEDVEAGSDAVAEDDAPGDGAVAAGDDDADEAADTATADGGEEPAAPIEWSEEDLVEHARMVEALLFAASEPLDQRSISDRLPTGADVPTLLQRLAEQYSGRGVVLSKISNKWRFVTAVDVAHVLEKEKVQQRRLSRAALETLAIIAYHQPCTRADIEDVRGVAVSKGSLDQLLEIGWVKLRGKREAPGRPTLYGTSQSFLEHFGLESVQDLPGLADLKAAGLLDARLPPGFTVPSPVEGGDEEEAEGGEEAEFAQDFLEEDGPETAEG